ncbi:MAG: S41 family peptidase, partial [Bdellovibrionota bacterium]
MMKLRLSTFIVFGISFFAFLCGGAWTFIYSKAREKEAYEDLDKFIQVYDMVKKNYVKEPEDEVLVDGAIQGMLDDLDPHSVYLSKKDFTEMQADTKGEYGGLGIEISKRDDALTVVTPMEDTPASRAGLQAGDVIVKIEDKPTAKMTIFEAVDLMKGKPGTKVNLTIKRESKNEFIPVTIERAVIKVKSVRAELKEGFPVIRVRQFAEKTADQLR